MSRSGYTDDCDDMWGLIRWRGAVAAAIRGKRGQQALREILAALDAMPSKALAAESLVTTDGEFCTLGALGAKRGVDMSQLDPDDPDAVAKAFCIAPALVKEIVYENDETIDDHDYAYIEMCGPIRTGPPFWEQHERSVRVPRPNVAERRWWHMRNWVAAHINTEAAS